eukprot:TRINITY_DN578_c0_g1_i11.p1 TRINITY_DN578_c0_g1~~TRINITY_DN578_c0_g1_i11.p1  ORF type:complete len:165 (-),score=37.83 TRINITY_DN578_c0_g1_i11:72-494(-)
MVQFNVAGLTSFSLDLDANTPVREARLLAAEECGAQPEHMRLILKDKQLTDADLIGDSEATVQILFTAGHQGLLGGSQVPKVQRNPFGTPVRGLPGSKGDRISRMSGRHGGMGLIRKYGILMKRQEFREKAEEIGFVKYR